ncbi:MAG: hypothetical protein V3W31_09000 [Thermodesulfobacteriota bacterium]
MIRRGTITILAVFFAAVITSGGITVRAQEPPGPPPGGGELQSRQFQGGGRGEEGKDRREQIRKKIALLYMWRLTETLDLDEATAAKLFPVLNRYNKKKMPLERERMKLIIEAREASKTGDESGSEELLKRVEKNQSALRDLGQEQAEEMKKVLTPAQMVKYLTFEEKFREEVRGMIRDARQKRGMRGGPQEREGGAMAPGLGP